MPPNMRQAWFVDHSPGRGGQAAPPPVPPCTFSGSPITLGIPGGGGTSSAAAACSHDGSVVVGDATISGVQSAVYWQGGNTNVLSTLAGATFSEALDVNGNGNIIIGRSSDNAAVPHAVYWTAGVITDLGFLPGGTASRALSCDTSGLIIGGDSTVGGIRHATLWTNGVAADLGIFAGNNAQINGVSDDGSVAVGQGGATSTPLKWVNGGAAIALPLLAGDTSGSAFSTNNNGTVIVGRSVGTNIHAVYWDINGVHDLGTLPSGNHSIALDVSSDGTIIVGVSDFANGTGSDSRPVYWKNGVLVDKLHCGTATGAELVTNGGFVGGTAGWTLGNNVVYGSNNVVSLYSGGDPSLKQTTIATTANHAYQVAFTVSAASPSTDGMTFYFTNNSFTLDGGVANGSYTFEIAASFTGTDTFFLDDNRYINGDTWTVTSVSIKEMTATVLPTTSFGATGISGDGEVIVGAGKYNSGSFPVGAIEWLCQ